MCEAVLLRAVGAAYIQVLFVTSGRIRLITLTLPGDASMDSAVLVRAVRIRYICCSNDLAELELFS